MFKLLNLTPLSYSTATAQKNYRRIMSVIHPDKNNAPNAEEISKAVTHAYDNLSSCSKRTHYMRYGTPSSAENYDDSEAIRLAEEMNILLAEHESAKHTRPKADDSNEYASCGVNVPDLVESRFETFLRQCREAASANRPDETQASYTTELQQDEIPLKEPGESKIATQQGDNAASNHSAHPNIPSPKAQEVIDIDSDSSDSDEEHICKGSRNSYVLGDETPPSFFSSMFPEEPSDNPHSPTQNHATPPSSPSKRTPPASPAHASCRTFKDVGTSPFKPGDPVTFFVLPSGSSPTRPPLFTKNLNADMDDNSPDRSYSSGCPSQGTSSAHSTKNNRTSTPGAQLPRIYISEILGMRTRPDGVKFKVRWGPSGRACNEKAETVLEEGIGLRRWLFRMRYEEPRRFRAILRFHPNFKTVLSGVPAGFYDASDMNSDKASDGDTSKRNATFA